MLIETFVVGLVASMLGVLVGVALAPGLAAMLKAFGLDLGTTGLVLKSGTVIIGLVVGLVATMVSGFVPARRATRVEPVAAMRDSVTPGLGHLRRRRVVGAAGLMLAGLVALFVGLFGSLNSGSAAASLLGLGALLMMFGVALLAPLLVRPLARVLGAPLARWRGLTGVLARENAIRQPQRTAVTAAALMVGLALVVFVTIFAAGLKASVNKAIDDQVTASLIVQTQNGFNPIPNQTVDVVRQIPGRHRRLARALLHRQGARRGRQHGRHRRRPGDDRRRCSTSSGTRASQATLRALGSDQRRGRLPAGRSRTTSRWAACCTSPRRPARSCPTRSPARSRTRRG